MTDNSVLFLYVFITAVAVCCLQSCSDPGQTERQSGLPAFADSSAAMEHEDRKEAPAPDYDQYSDLKIPPLSPDKALETFELEDGFRIEIVAHEPEVIDPVAMDVDRDGRLWVVEMQSYMPVHNRDEEKTSELERVPESRIVVLEDTTGDGRMDVSRVFMDGLVLPRAIKVMDSGVLIAEPPRLWFIQDTTGDGIGDTKEIVYENYGDPVSDNVEHMANGLMWGMDNWIHSVYSDMSFRRVDGEWVTRPFETMTQWGITQDSWGRIYSSHNSRTLVSHLVPYGYSYRHPQFSLDEGINASIAESETMWPAHPTGVNRGYRVNEIVRENGTLKRSTSTCGPVIYRGNQFGEEYQGNAFVPEPAGNLIKRLVGIDENPGEIETKASFAYEGREFLTSTDERFRPVNLYNAPDGSIYVLDMYRGIIQHAYYLTDHLQNYAVKHDLHKPEGQSRFGRIYRIVREDRPVNYKTPKLSTKKPEELARYLTHENGMLRDAAQQLLVQRSPSGAIPLLERYVNDLSMSFHTRLQALWSLDGYDDDVYSPEQILGTARTALRDPHPRIRAAAMRILEPEIRKGAEELILYLEEFAAEESEPYPLLQLLASLGEAKAPWALDIIADILNRHKKNPYFREMALTTSYQREQELIGILSNQLGWREAEGDSLLKRLAEAARQTSVPELQLTREQQRLYSLGKQQYRTCMACHGNNGQGVSGVGPALAGSEWVQSEANKPVRILLQGLEKPESKYPDVMPSHQFMSDEDVAAVLTYIRKSWGNDARPITPEEVAAIRKATEDRQTEWTPGELRKLDN